MNPLPRNGAAEHQLIHQLRNMRLGAEPEVGDARINQQAVLASMDVEQLAADLRQTCRITKPASIAFDPYSAHRVPPSLLDEVNVRDCPKIVWHIHEFVWPTLEWIKICKFEFNQTYADILSEYQRLTDTSVHWRAVLEAGRELIAAAYLAYEYPDYEYPDPHQTARGISVHQGPSRSQEEFDARVKIWQVKKEVWEATIYFANSPLQQSLDAVLLVNEQLDLTLINEERHGLFEPWQEFAPTQELRDQIEHTRHLPNPFDPILFGGMTMTELAQRDDA